MGSDWQWVDRQSDHYVAEGAATGSSFRVEPLEKGLAWRSPSSDAMRRA